MQSLITKVKVLFLAVVILSPLTTAKANAGRPGTFQFGYGARVSLHEPALDTVLQTIEETGFDWLAVNYDWAHHWPQRDIIPQWEQLDYLMDFTQAHNIAVMVSITGCPTWAKGETGPSLYETANLIVTLQKRYPNSLGAVELFPAPNTIQGWGAFPNPADYAHLLNYIHETLQANSLETDIVLGGLMPLLEGVTSPGDMHDLDFLNGLYKAITIEYMPVIGLRFPNLVGQPYQSPSSSVRNSVLRHYEQIRQVMLDNGHKSGLIWITGFSWPSELSNVLEQNTPDLQAQWLQEAYHWISSQIYVGVAFFTISQPNNAVSSDFSHPAFQSLQQQISIEKAQNQIPLPITYRSKFAFKSFRKILCFNP